MQSQDITPYKPKSHIRIVTAASLFDGHDAAINIMRRIIQSTGAEVIHLGHDRSVKEIVVVVAVAADVGVGRTGGAETARTTTAAATGTPRAL